MAYLCEQKFEKTINLMDMILNFMSGF